MADIEEMQRDDAVELLVAAVMRVERRYAHALRGAVSDRLEGIREAIELSTEAAE